MTARKPEGGAPRDTPRDSDRPTLKTIAAETGLAIATVSRALKNAPDIGEATKQRVRETAKRLGYRPNRAGVRLRTGKTNVIALALAAEPNVMNHTSQLIYSIANALRGTAYHLVVMPYFPDQDPMEPIRYIVETESADGVILNQTQAEDPRIRYLAEHRFPFATHGRTLLGYDAQSFDYDNDAYARLAIRELAARGRRRVLLLAPPRSQMYAHHLIEGAIAESQIRGLSLEILSEVSSDSDGAAIEAAIALRFTQDPPPDGVISGSTTGAMAATAGAEARGLVLGRDFDIIAKEAIPVLHRFRREMIVVHEDVGRAGEALAHTVIAAIEGRQPDPGERLEVPVAVTPGPA